MPISRAGIAVVTIGLLVGCGGTDNATKRQIGTVGGAVVGGVAGALFGEGTGRIATAAIGAAAGGLLGNLIGGVLDEQDQAAVNQEAAAALENADDGESVEWSNPDTGASATLTPKETQVVEKHVVVVRDRKVVETPTLELIGKPYQAKSAANVRAAPSADAEVLAGVQEHERFNVVGKVEDGSWYLISRDGRSIGYVHGNLIEPSTQVVQTQLRQEPVDLDAMELNEDVVADTVSAQTQCRTLDLEVAAEGGQQEQTTFEACKAADGAWELG